MLGISKETVHALPEVHYPGRVILIDSAAKARDAVAYLLKQQQIGFDTETRPSFQKNHRYKVSLVQLSVPGECFLFRLKQIGSFDGLISIFEHPGIQKIGLSLKDDFHSLAKLFEFKPAGFIELQTFVKQYDIADNSLQKIFALIFGQRISKNQRLTNWEAQELTISQQNYAAIDAWACVEIYNHLCSGSFHPEESPYQIDDDTARMLQNSVGIHLPVNPEDNNQAIVVPDINDIVLSEPSADKPRRRKHAVTVKAKSTSDKSKTKSPKSKTASAKTKKTATKTASVSKSAKSAKSAVKPAEKASKTKTTRSKTKPTATAVKKTTKAKAAPDIQAKKTPARKRRATTESAS